MDPSGKSVYNQKLSNPGAGKQVLEINLEQLPAGLYYVNIIDENGKFATKKIIKMN